MARRTGLVGKALQGLRAAATGGRAATEPSGASEKAVGIPEIAVFSELPFAQVGVIGGKANIVANSSAAPRKAKKKIAPKKSSAPPKAKKGRKKTAVKKAVKRKKAT